MKRKPDRAAYGGGNATSSIQVRLAPLTKLVEQSRYHEIVPAARDLLRVLPHHPYVLKALSFGLIGMRNYDAALPVLEQALRQNALDPELHNNLGICLSAVWRWDEAVKCFDHALELDGNDAEVWKNKGEALCHMNRWGDAVPFLVKAIELYPGDFDAAINTLARALANSRRYEEAFVCYTSLSDDERDNPGYLGNLIFAGLATCRWNALEENVARLRTLTGDFERVGIAPLHALSIPGLSAAELRRIAETYMRTEIPTNLPLLAPLQGYTHERLRIGYLSSNLNMHAVTILTAEVFELHDRSQVEIYAFCWSPEDGTPMRHRIRAAMDHLIRIDTMSDEQAAQAIRAAEIDVLIDLQGLTSGCRPVILAHKPAPVQISWLGFPGTSALPGVDYILADHYLIPDADVQHYAEQPLYLPNCFQANDRQRRIGAIPTRSDCQLRNDQFVFCVFNHNHKFNPEMFGCWMRILVRVPGSVLWLLADNETARVNLSAYAQAHGVAAERLIFASRVSPERYLVRFAVADLFLDTLPFNGGTTVSDALWAGLPVLTCSGRTFAGRMAGSLLHSVGLPELVTHTLADYEAQAVRLANDREVLCALRARLAESRVSAPCFDTPQLVRDLENVLFGVAKGVMRLQESSDRIEQDGGNATCDIQAALSPLNKLVEQYRYHEVVPVARDLLRDLPNHPYVLKALSFGLIGMRDYDAALPVLEQALRQNALDPELHNNLGICLSAVLRWDEAVKCFDHALELDGSDPVVWKNKGESYCHMNRWGEAIPFLLKAIELYPGDFDAAINTLAQALANSGRHEEAFVCYTSLSDDEPDNPGYLGNLIFAGLATCRWNDLAENVARLRTLTGDFERVGIAPLHALSIPGLSAAELHRIAATYARTEIPPCVLSLPALAGRTVDARAEKRHLRIGYLSYDFVKNHPVAHVIPQVIELHDRNRVQVFGYSMGPDDGSAVRQRIASASDHFVDIGMLGVEASASRIAEDAIDILVDLQGWTTGGRPATLARRSAPIQANWLGYAGSMGMERLADYLIGDPIVIPAENEKFFVERIARLPHCYLPMDATQIIPNAPSRAEAGLPEDAFVFCSMNNRYKFNPQVYDIWCRLLSRIPGSCLWLTHPSGQAADNLVREAVARGVAAQRIIFAPHVASRADHLARLQLADLALDPSPYNSHSSGIDTLWAGVPMVTLLGETFAGRVGASLVTAAGLPECVTHSWDEYLDLCVDLHNNPQRLQELRARLVAGRRTAPLFDMNLFVRSLEDLYFTMWKEKQTAGVDWPA